MTVSEWRRMLVDAERERSWDAAREVVRRGQGVADFPHFVDEVSGAMEAALGSPPERQVVSGARELPPAFEQIPGEEKGKVRPTQAALREAALPFDGPSAHLEAKASSPPLLALLSVSDRTLRPVGVFVSAEKKAWRFTPGEAARALEGLLSGKPQVQAPLRLHSPDGPEEVVARSLRRVASALARVGAPAPVASFTLGGNGVLAFPGSLLLVLSARQEGPSFVPALALRRGEDEVASWSPSVVVGGRDGLEEAALRLLLLLRGWTAGPGSGAG